LELDPEHLKSLNRRGIALYYLGKYKESKSDLSRVVTESGGESFETLKRVN